MQQKIDTPTQPVLDRQLLLKTKLTGKKERL